MNPPKRTFRQYKLDDFQYEAVCRLLEGHSVLVSAPTGVGKTLIADYLIEEAIAKGDRIIYTAPIKALSNQKFKEFKALYGEERVGIITGDVVIRPEADVTLMTTEIFRNILHQDPGRLAGISHVIFDEIHYLSDEDRGTVWEESIIFMPEGMRLLGLSATIPNARELADWISEIKGHRVVVITKLERAVPLEHYVYTRRTGPTTLKELVRAEEERRKREEKAGKNGRRDFRRLRKGETTHRDLVRTVVKAHGLPCLYFVFSRRMCEEKAYELAQDQDFLKPEEKETAEKIIDQMVRDFGLDSWRTMGHVKNLLLKGIAFHHAGLLPAHKEIVEALFGQNLVRVMYATETFAVGINYPVRTVCFDAPTKWDGVTFRPMSTLEYFQMAGRAGRRGIDERGFVYILADLDRYPPEDFPSTDPADIEELRSRFNLSYNSVLNLNKSHSPEEINRILNQNFATFQARNDKVVLERQLHRLQKKFENMAGEYCGDWSTVACPRLREETQRRIRRQERKLRYIKGRRARQAIMDEIKQMKQTLLAVPVRDCDAARVEDCQRKNQQFQEVLKAKEELEQQIANIKVAGRFDDDLSLKEAILEEIDYLKDGKLLPRGEFASQIYAQELLITELYFNGLFHEWTEDQINAVIVAVDYEPRKGEFLPRSLPYDPKPIRRIIRQLLYHYGVEERDVRFHPSLSNLAFKWSQGCEFFELLQDAPHLQEGDIVAAFRRGIDLLRQIRGACLQDDPILAGKLKNCMDKMDRDLVQVNL